MAMLGAPLRRIGRTTKSLQRSPGLGPVAAEFQKRCAAEAEMTNRDLRAVEEGEHARSY